MTQVTLFPKTDFSILTNDELFDARTRLGRALEVVKAHEPRGNIRAFVCHASRLKAVEYFNDDEVNNVVARVIENVFRGISCVEIWLGLQLAKRGLIEGRSRFDLPDYRIKIFGIVFGDNSTTDKDYDALYDDANFLGNKYRLLWIPRMIAEVDALIESRKEDHNETVL